MWITCPRHYDPDVLRHSLTQLATLMIVFGNYLPSYSGILLPKQNLIRLNTAKHPRPHLQHGKKTVAMECPWGEVSLLPSNHTALTSLPQRPSTKKTRRGNVEGSGNSEPRRRKTNCSLHICVSLDRPQTPEWRHPQAFHWVTRHHQTAWGRNQDQDKHGVHGRG